MNKTIWTRDYNDFIESVGYSDEQLTLTLKGGKKITLEGYHSQDCCEHVWADFSVVPYHLDRLISSYLTTLTIKAVEDMGFLLCFYRGGSSEKIFIACYDEQNGYYSSNLSLIINDDGIEERIDVSDCVEHNHY